MTVETYRQLVTLGDGVRLVLRPLCTEDEDALVDLYKDVSSDDLRSLRSDVTDSSLVRGWVQELDYDKVLPLLAVQNERIVGNATLHRSKGPYRHIGEVRIFLAKDFRKRGLGTKMLEVLIELARREGLHWLKAEVFANQPKVIRAFEGLGFERQCTYVDYFMLSDGSTEDITLLLMRLLEPQGEF